MEKEIKFDHPWRIFFWEAFFFSSTLVLGIGVAFRLNKLLDVSIERISPWHFLIYFILATLFLVALSFLKRSKKGKAVIYRGLFIFAVFFGGTLTLGLWLQDFLALIIMVILVLLWIRKPLVFIHNLCVILGIAGAGAILGLRIDPQFVIIILLALSVYDFIAVYKTKHMVKLAKEMIESRAILGLIIPSSLSGLREDFKEIKIKGRFLFLGGGDVAFPLVLCASLVPSGVSKSLFVGFFALIGLSFSFYIFINQKTRKPIPALPPIAVFAILGYLIAGFLRL